MALKLTRDANLTAKHQGFVYQVAAVEAIKDLTYGAVFHEQGLGKTKIGVDLGLSWLKSNAVDSVLIVTKRGLIQNWLDELSAHSYLSARVLSQDRKKNFYAFNSPSRLYLAHYEAISSEKKRMALFLKTRMVGVILDEAHKIKNPESQITKAFFDLSSEFTRKIIMTGTPVANRPFDIWSQIFFLDQGKALGNDFAEFRKSLDLRNELAFDQKKATDFQQNLAGVFGKLESFCVRETKDDLEIKLPNKVIRNISVQLEWRQAEIYDTIRQECAVHIVKDNEALLDKSDDILKRLLRLVQVSSNPKLIDDRYEGIPGKFEKLEFLLREIVAKGEKAIVWTSFTHNVDWLARGLSEFGPLRIHGKLDMNERNRSIKSFKNDPTKSVLIATPGSAKEGLTLTVANHAIFFDRTFSLDDYLQAQDRIHRISQERICFVTNLIGEGTIDEWVDVLLSAKQLAAKLAQGDITKDEYEQEADYTYGEMIREVLNLPRKENQNA
jgi:SNF2 family DNA or RNA helicase